MSDLPLSKSFRNPDLLANPGRGGSRTAPTVQTTNFGNFSEFLSQLSSDPQGRQKFGPCLDKLLALQHQYDTRLLCKELFNIGCELADRGMTEGAVTVFAALVGVLRAAPAGGQEAPLQQNSSAFQDILARAQEHLNALQGNGNILPRVEHLAKQMPKEIFNLSGFSAMAAAMPTFRFTTAAAKAILGTGIGPWLAANTIGFLAESAMFTSAGREVRELIDGRGDSRIAHPTWAQEWVYGMPMLLGLKTFGGLAGLAGQALLAKGYGYTALQSFSLWGMHQVAMLNGIMFGNHVSEPNSGRDFWMQLAEAGVTAVHFNAVGPMLGAVANPHEALRRDVAETIRRLPVSPSPRLTAGPQLATEGPRFNPQSEIRNPKSQGPQSLMSALEQPSTSNNPDTPLPSAYVASAKEAPQSPQPPVETTSTKKTPFLIRVMKAAIQIDWNRFRDPDSKLHPVSTAPLPAPVESIEQGILLAMAKGEPANRLVMRARRDLLQLEKTPQAKQKYLEVEAQRQEFQKGLRERLDPILQKLKLPSNDKISEAVTEYEKNIQEVLGQTATTMEADALIDLRNSWRMQNPGLREAFREKDLSIMGYEPNAIEWAKKNSDIFLPGSIEATLRFNHELNTAQGADRLAKAARIFDQEVVPLQQEVRRWTDQLLELEKGDVKLHATKKAELAQKIKDAEITNKELFEELNEAFKEFLSNPSIAKLWLAENTLHASVRRLLRSNPNEILEKLLTNLKRPLEFSDSQWHQLQDEANAVLTASLRLQAEKNRAVRSPLDRLARLVGKRDYQALWQAKGDYEEAYSEFLIAYENTLLPQAIQYLGDQLHSLPSVAVLTLGNARENLFTVFSAHADLVRRQWQDVEPELNEFIRYHDTELVPLREQGLRMGMLQISELLEGIRDKIGSARYDQEVKLAFDEILQAFEDSLNHYRRTARLSINGPLPPREFNRKIEKSLEIVFRTAHEFLLETAKKYKIPLGEVLQIIPLFETYTHKWDLAAQLSPSKRLSKGIGYAWPALREVTSFISGIEKGYPFESASRLFLDFGYRIGRKAWPKANPQTFYLDPSLSPVVSYFGYTITGDHNTHLDFIGHADNVVQAHLGSRATNYSIPDIIAKFDLKIPVIDQVFPYLVNLIPNDSSGVRSAEIRAAHMQAFGSLPHRRHQPTPPLLYDNITMDVTTGEGPYVRDPHAPVTGSLPVLGRSFKISEAAAVLTGRPQGIMFIEDPGAIRNYPSQRGPMVVLNNPSSLKSLFLPLNGFPQGGTSRTSPRKNVERLIWYLQAFHPETDPPAPDTNRFYEKFQNPVDLHVEKTVSQMFAGMEEVYSTPEGIQRLETKREELRQQIKTSTNGKNARLFTELGWVDRALDQQTRRFLGTRMRVMDQELEAELQKNTDPVEAKGLRRMQRILKARLKLLNQVERKLEKQETLSLTERKFVEQASAAIAGRENISGRDHILEQLNYYLHTCEDGIDLKNRLLEVQNEYYRFVEDWNEKRKNPDNLEAQQLHVSEDKGYAKVWNNYRVALETLFNLQGITPTHWKGEIFPDIQFRQKEGSLIVEPRDWKPSTTEFSRMALWKFILSDTIGIVKTAKAAKNFDPSPDLYLTIHRAWGHRTLQRTQTRLRVDNTENLIQAANVPSIIAPTHDSGIEFPTLPSVLHDYGFRAFFMADRKFFDPFWGQKSFSILGMKFALPFPQGPAFGLIRALLGPMEQYGHFSIDRSDRKAALKSMEDSGQWIRENGRSLIIFPGATRNPIRYNDQGERYEGPFYGSKPGLAYTWEGAQSPLVPLGLVNGGVIFPKQNGDAYLKRGAAIGREYGIKFGQPLSYDKFISRNPSPNGDNLKKATVTELDRQFHILTGRKIGEPAPSKAKKKTKK